MQRASGFFLYLSVLLGALSACSKSGGKSEPQSALAKADYRKDLARFQIVPERPYDVDRYTLISSYDRSTRQIKSTETIDLVVKNDTDRLDLDAEKITIEQLLVKSERGEIPASFALDSAQLKIQLGRKVSAGNRVRIVVKFIVQTDHGESGVNKLGAVSYVPLDTDPNKNPMLFTSSEPVFSRRWLISNAHPADRAKLDISFTHAADEEFLANGARKSSTANSDGTVTTRYETQHSLPTYTMAMALGRLNCLSAHSKLNTPVRVCIRKDHPAKLADLVAFSVHLMNDIEEALGAFPFESYTTVFVPRLWAAGMENTGLTVVDERLTSLLDRGARTTLTHELAHQYFGDYVTVKSWDDVWIKEGLASLVHIDFTPESAAADADYSFFPVEFDDGLPVLNPTAAPLDKYNSGIYERGAVFFAQVATLMGHDKFWQMIKEILAKHAYGTIDTETLLNYMSARLDKLPDAKNKLRRALLAKKNPKILYRPDDEKKNFSARLHDPDGFLLVSAGIGTIAVSPPPLQLLGTETVTGTIQGPPVVDLGISVPWEIPLVGGPNDEALHYAGLEPEVTDQILKDQLAPLSSASRVRAIQMSMYNMSTPTISAVIEWETRESVRNVLRARVCQLQSIPGRDEHQWLGETSSIVSSAVVSDKAFQACVLRTPPIHTQSLLDPSVKDPDLLLRLQRLGIPNMEITRAWLRILKSAPTFGIRHTALMALNNLAGGGNQKIMFNLRAMSPAEWSEYRAALAEALALYANEEENEFLQNILKWSDEARAQQD